MNQIIFGCLAFRNNKHAVFGNFHKAIPGLLYLARTVKLHTAIVNLGDFFPLFINAIIYVLNLLLDLFAFLFGKIRALANLFDNSPSL